MRCAKGMYSVMSDTQRHFFDIARPDTMKCMAAYLYKHCVEKLIDKEDRARANAAPSEDLRRLRDIRDIAVAFFRNSCTPDVPFSNADDNLVNDVKRRWDASPGVKVPSQP